MEQVLLLEAPSYQFRCFSDVLDIGGVSFEFGLPTAVEEAQEPEEEEVPHDELLDEDDHLLEIEEEPEDLDIDDFEEIEEKPKKKKKPKAKPKPKPKAEPKKAEPKKAPPKAEPKKSRAAPKPDKIVEEVEQEEEIKKAEPKQPKAEQPPKSKTLKRKREPDPVLPVYPPGENPYPKPEFSYAAMLAEAINAEPERRLSLQGLYESLRERYPYFRYAGTKWKVGTLAPQTGFSICSRGNNSEFCPASPEFQPRISKGRDGRSEIFDLDD